MREVITSIKSKGSDKPELINVGDSFKLIYTFNDIRYTPPYPIPLDTFDIEFSYYVKGREEIYLASKIGDTCVNCIMVPEESTIKVLFDNHNLKSGFLFSKLKFLFPDNDYPDLEGSVIKIVNTGIVLIDPKY